MHHALICEDNVSFRRILHEVLASHFPGLTIEEAGDGHQALAKAAAGRHDLVLTDIKMPGPNGFEVVRAVKADNPGALVLVITSHDLPEYREAARRCGADHFIVKNDDIQATVARAAAAAFRPPARLDAGPNAGRV